MSKEVENILVVAPDCKESLNLSSRLRTQGYQCRQAAGGFQALSMLEEDNCEIDCIIFIGDSLEEMGTQEAIGHIRSRWEAEEICIFHLSENKAHIFDSISLGANHALSGENFNDVVTRLKSVKLK